MIRKYEVLEIDTRIVYSLGEALDLMENFDDYFT